MTVPTFDQLMGMSDEEFLSFQASNPSAEPAAETSGDEQIPDATQEGNSETEEHDEGTQTEPELEGNDELPEGEGDEESPEPELDEQGNPVAPAEGEGQEVQQPAKPAPKQAEQPAEVTAEDFRSAILAPLRANKRDIQINSVDEARKLMAKGANYGLKMQQLAPHLKTLQMLENNGIQSAEELAYLIDLRNKNPEAIQKLLKDSQFDTLGFDPEAQVDYSPKTAIVTDRDAVFAEAVNDIVTTTESGPALIQSLNNWDVKSQEFLADNTARLYDLNQHKESGIFDVIMTEVHKQRAVGNIPQDMTDIEAYTRIGDHIRDNEGFESHLTPEQIAAQQQRMRLRQAHRAQTQPARQPVARRVAVPKPTTQNNDKARAAASTARATAKQPSIGLDDLSKMSDDEFMKSFKGRL